MTVIRQRKFFSFFLVFLFFVLCVFTPLLTSPVSGSVVDELPREYKGVWISLLSNLKYQLYQRITTQWIKFNGLSVVYHNESENRKKFSLVFDSSSFYADYKIVVSVSNVRNHSLNRDNHTFYMMFDNFDVWLNYSDLLQYDGLIFDWGRQGSTFFLSIQKNHIKDIHLVLDPRYSVSYAYIATGLNYPNGHKIVRMSNGTLCVAYYYAYTMGIPVKYVLLSAFNENNGSGTWQIRNITKTYGALSGNIPICPAIAVDSHDNIHCVYMNNTRVGYRMYNASTKTWGLETKIGDSAYAYPVWYPSVAVDWNDAVHVAWGQVIHSTVGRNNIRYQNLTGGVWGSITNVTSLNVAGTSFLYPTVQVDYHNNVYVFSRRNWSTSSKSLYCRKLNDSGVWGTNTALVTLANTNFFSAPVSAVFKINKVGCVFTRNSLTLPANTRTMTFVSTVNNGTSWVVYHLYCFNTTQYPKECSISVDGNNDGTVVFTYNVTGARNEPLRIVTTNNSGVSWETTRLGVYWKDLDSGSANRRCPSMLWSLLPINSTNIHADLPKKKFALVWMNATTVRYYVNGSIEWGAEYGVSVVPSFFPSMLSNVYKGLLLYVMFIWMVFGFSFFGLVCRRRKKKKVKK